MTSSNYRQVLGLADKEYINMNISNVSSVKVKNMTSPKTGNPVANQYIIRVYATDKDGRQYATDEYFQSYDSIIAHRRLLDDRITLDKDAWDYSVTTGKYRNEFLNEGIADTRKSIKNGTYKLANLN